ncbi:MAG: hypothetical protein HN572_08185, partial [Kordiimonadaceae bacterium]|nr:hypothetical protein [Kordiimonadaceae bacterium]
MKSIHGPNSMSFLPYLLTRVLPVGAVIMAVAGFIGLGITQNIAEKKADELIARQSSQTKAVIKDRLNNIESQTEVLSRNALIINGLIDLEGRDNYLPAFFRTLQVAGHANAKIEMADYKGRRIFTNRVENGFHVKPKEWPKEI